MSGGLPEPALVYQKTKSNAEMLKIKAKIRSCIEADFLKFNKGLSPKRIHEIWSCLISKPKFQDFHFCHINSHSRIREYDKSLHWLLDSGPIYEVSGEHFNRYLLPDVGIYFSNENTMNLKCKERPKLDTVIKLGRMSDTMRWENGYVKISKREMQHSFLCFTSTGFKGFSSMNNSILFKIDNHDSSISPDCILRLPPFFIEDFLKFSKTAKSQVELNKYPKKVAHDFY